MIETIEFSEGAVRIIDQTLLPLVEKYVTIDDRPGLEEAIRSLRVRGAPAIGIAAAYGILLELQAIVHTSPGGEGYHFDRKRRPPFPENAGLDMESARARLASAAAGISETRPTAVNLFWAVERMVEAINMPAGSPGSFCENVSSAAFDIHETELEVEKTLGLHGASLLTDGMTVLTHCNAGGLATAGYGTALGVIYAAAESGKRIRVFADETRPLLQGARLTAWELKKNGIETVVICDGASHSLIASGEVDLVLTGADRIAANGDTANKIGTLGLAVSCERAGVPFCIAAPLSTVDMGTASGSGIEIENRGSSEIEYIQGVRIVPEGVGVFNPAFDVTPAGLISAIITEKGVLRPPFGKALEGCFDQGGKGEGTGH
ncbi:MAG TPA: S-methyl-5-thioribose-1-phosphate isomerase [Candidatus Krumholzibacterium sp.]|nr:S-methyl-5-thioribose-1-phosphate isomerase [Candidatus Krumholzibacterium sp.]